MGCAEADSDDAAGPENTAQLCWIQESFLSSWVF